MKFVSGCISWETKWQYHYVNITQNNVFIHMRAHTHMWNMSNVEFNANSPQSFQIYLTHCTYKTTNVLIEIVT